MKTKVTILAAIAFALGACTTGTYVTDRYSDVYFEPGDVPPPVAVEEPAKEESSKSIIIQEVEENEDGTKTLKNYVFEDAELSDQVYDMENMELIESDTTIYENDGDIDYVVNNYYDADELDYAYRIRRFHRPYFYDPFYWDSWLYYDSWYSPYYSWHHYNYYRPWGYWHRPYLSWSFGWHSPFYYSSWYSPYYSHYHYSPYYWGGGHYYSHNYYRDDIRYGRRTSPNYYYNNRTTQNANAVSRTSRSAINRSSGNNFFIQDLSSPSLTRKLGNFVRCFCKENKKKIYNILH